MKFKVGDKVCIKDGADCDSDFYGKEVTILEVDGSPVPYRAKARGWTVWFAEDEVEPVLDVVAPLADPKRAFGATKPSVALVPAAGVLYAALAAEDGAEKYGPFNWRGTNVEAMTYLNAALRHIQAYIDGENNTSDTGVPNLGAAIMSLAIIADATECGTLIDNRPAPGKASEIQTRMQAWKRAKAEEK